MLWEIFRRIGVNISFSVNLGLLLFLLVSLSVGELGARDQRIVSLSVEGRGLPGSVSPGFHLGDSVNSAMIEKGKEKIRQWLFDRGFWANKVAVEVTIDDGGLKVRYFIDSIIRARFGGWLFNGGDARIQEKVARSLPSKKKILSSKVINRAEERVATVYREAGFPWARAVVTGIDETAGFLYPVIQIDTGPKVIIKFITFDSKLRISAPLLIHYTGFKKDAVYSSRVVERWRRGLERSGWVKVDSADMVMRADGSYGTRYWISASRSGEFFGIAGYLSEERRLTGWVRLRLFNLMGSGRKIEGEWQSIGGFSHYRLIYSQPWVFHLPIELSGAVEQNVFDTSYSFTTLSITGGFTVGDAGFIASTGLDRTLGRDNSRTRWLGSGVTFDSRDHSGNPRRGLWVGVYSRAGQRDNGTKSSVITKIEIDLEPVIPLVGNYVLVNHFATRVAFAQYEMSAPELYRMGGILSVRGYRDGAFLTARAGWWNCELRYNFSTGSRVQIFFDSGAFQNQSSEYQTIAGYGAGGRWETKVGILGIDYGMAWGRSFGESKIHLSFEAGF